MSASTNRSNRALLLSPELNSGSRSSCFQYSYRRIGSAQGKLTIFQQTFVNENTRTELIKHEYTDFQNEWSKGQIEINQPLNNSRLLFEGFADGKGENGALLLDDFSLIAGSCPRILASCSIICDTASNIQQCLTTNQRCDFNIDCLNGNDERPCGYTCDFETTQCGWSNSFVSNYQWQRKRAGVATVGSVNILLLDHTTYTPYGYYMIVTPNNGSFHERAQFLSPVLQQSLSTCTMIFFYYMNGTNVGRLEVLLITGTQISRLWAREGSQGNRWNKGIVQNWPINSVIPSQY